MQTDESALDIIDFLRTAEMVLGEHIERVGRVTKIGLAESALAAPFASFGGVSFYPDPIHRAAILCSRICRNHPLPDGNKRVAYLLMTEQLYRAGFGFDAGDQQHTAEMVERLAADDVSEQGFAEWLATRVIPIEKREAS